MIKIESVDEERCRIQSDGSPAQLLMEWKTMTDYIKAFIIAKVDMPENKVVSAMTREFDECMGKNFIELYEESE